METQGRLTTVPDDIGPVQFAAGDASVDARLVDIDIDDTRAVTATIELDADSYRRGDEGGLFHLTPLLRGPGANGFEPHDQVRIELRLDPQLRAGVLALTPDRDQLATALRNAADDSPLRHADSWYALSVTVTVDVPADLADVDDEATLREGYRTAWSGHHHGRGELPLIGFLGEHLERRGWTVEPLTNQPGFRWSMSGRDGAWECFAVVDEDAGWCVLWSVLEGEVDDDRLDSVTAQIGALNSGLLFGTWQLTDPPRRIQLRSSIELPDRTGAAVLLGRLVERNLDIVDEYFGSF